MDKTHEQLYGGKHNHNFIIKVHVRFYAYFHQPLALDASWNVYVAGTSYATWGTPVMGHMGYYKAFAAKLNGNGGYLQLRLAYRPPYDWPALVAFLGPRAIPGVVQVESAAYRRTVKLDGVTGVIEVRPDLPRDALTLRVPVAKCESAGMRKLSDQTLLAKAMDTLRGRARVKRTMWSRRAQEYESKINSGNLISIAEVVRDLYRSDSQPEQSYS